jgi:hypothetical protein
VAAQLRTHRPPRYRKTSRYDWGTDPPDGAAIDATTMSSTPSPSRSPYRTRTGLAPGRSSEATGTDRGSGPPEVGAVVTAAVVGATVDVAGADADGAETDGADTDGADTDGAETDGAVVAGEVVEALEAGGGCGDPE